MHRVSSFVAFFLALGVLLWPLLSEGSDPFLRVLTSDELAASPAQKYAAMSRDEAVAELKLRGAIFDEVPAEKAPGVTAPIRLTSRLNGVHIHGTEREAVAVRSPFEILDARLGLVLHDFGAILGKHGINEVVHFSMYRPGASHHGHALPSALPAPRRPGAVAARTSKGQARSQGSPAPSAGQTTSRHPAGLAIDVAQLRKKDGTSLRVDKQFAGKIGQKTCGQGAPAPLSSEARELRAIVCEASDAGLFTFMLTPNYNRAHHDHFHLEIKAGAPWVLVH